ncbi:MAG TPA: ubiquinol-cytochrome c reductase iron-sulfur subunit, partial [Sneathiellales bacterium]|nr:ubiquinol-cytochrome c reductase iron-sulfur subunit [Sneathiellales bacterium]
MASNTLDPEAVEQPERRDFLYIATGTLGAVGAAMAVWPLIDQMNPSKDVLALSSTEVDLSPIEEGQSVTVVWRGKPVFIRRRTQAEIDEAR